MSLLIGGSQFETYYGEGSESARSRITSGAIELFQDYFPLGSGFGTYGSGITQTIYSPLYSRFGFEQVYGLTPTNPFYLTDTFWPVVIAQFGLFGICIWIGILYFVIKEIYTMGKSGHKLSLSLAFIAAILISTTASGAVFSVQELTLLSAFVFAIHGGERCEGN